MWLEILGFILSSSLLAALMADYLSAKRGQAEKRRARYAETVSNLIAWQEYPYRIRRRVDDEPATLARLAELGHELQQKLAYDSAWVTMESPKVAKNYRAAYDAIREQTGPLAAKVWKLPPATSAERMNVTVDLEVPSPEEGEQIRGLMCQYTNASARRFGIRRVPLLGRLFR